MGGESCHPFQWGNDCSTGLLACSSASFRRRAGPRGRTAAEKLPARAKFSSYALLVQLISRARPSRRLVFSPRTAVDTKKGAVGHDRSHPGDHVATASRALRSDRRPRIPRPELAGSPRADLPGDLFDSRPPGDASGWGSWRRGPWRRDGSRQARGPDRPRVGGSGERFSALKPASWESLGDPF